MACAASASQSVDTPRDVADDHRARPDGLGEEPEEPARVGFEYPPPVEPVLLGRIVALRRHDQGVDDLLHGRVHGPILAPAARLHDRLHDQAVPVAAASLR